MGIIEIDYVQLREKCARLTELNLRLGEEVGEIAGYAKNADIFWDGDANNAYMKSIVGDIADMGLYLKKIGLTVGVLRKTLEMYIKNEREVQRLIGDRINERKIKI